MIARAACSRDFNIEKESTRHCFGFSTYFFTRKRVKSSEEGNELKADCANTDHD